MEELEDHFKSMEIPEGVKNVKGDSEMAPSEVSTKDPDLQEIVEREGMDLKNMVDKWRKKGLDEILVEQVDMIQYGA